MSNPKNHHYIPQSYQLLFSIDGKSLYYFDKKESKVLGPSGPRNFCSENFLYSLAGETAKKTGTPTLIENPILSTIDGDFASEVKKLISDNPDKTDVSLYNLSRFFGFLLARHPSLIDKCQSDLDDAFIKEALKYARNDDLEKKKHQKMELDLNDESQFEGLSFSESRNIALGKMIENAQGNAKFIHDSMGWLFLYSSEAEFLLCDTPLILKDKPIEIGELISASDEFIALIPLSRQLCLALSLGGKDIKHAFIKADHVEKINSLVIENAERWIISSTKEAIQNIRI